MDNEIQKRNMLLIQQYDYIEKNLNRSDSYKQQIKYFFDYLEEKSFNLSFPGFVDYYNFLDKQWIDGSYKTDTFNVRLCASKKAVKFLFEDSPYSNDMGKEFKLDKMLSNYKCREKESRYVSKDKYLTPAEIRTFIDNCSDKTISLLVEFLFNTACRISEVTNIRHSDISRINKHYEIVIRGKGKKSRTIPVSLELVDKIKKYYKSKTWLFEHEYKGQIKSYSPINLTNRVNKFALKIFDDKKESDLRFRCHTLRHSALTYLYDKSKDIKKVSLMAGHSSTVITANLYVHSKFEYGELEEYYKSY